MALPDAVPVGVDDREPAFPDRPVRVIVPSGTPDPPGRQARDHGEQQYRGDHGHRYRGRNIYRPSHPGAVQRLQQQFYANEGADNGQAGIQVADPVERPHQQHIQLAEPHQRQHVAGHDQGSPGRDAEDGRNRVEREHDVRQPDRNGQHQQRSGYWPPGPPDDQAVAVIVVGVPYTLPQP